MSDIYRFVVANADGGETKLSGYAGKVLLIANVASRCGFTPQLQGLEMLRRKYGSTGFEVLAFPCNQFLNQSPEPSEEFAALCRSRYATTFPTFAKVDVNGSDAHPLFTWLKSGAPGVLGTSAIKWNFTKFLVSKEGKPVVRYAPTMDPANVGVTIERLLRT